MPVMPRESAMCEPVSCEEFLLTALERYERPLTGYVMGITGELESARDVVQEVFIRLSQNAGTFDRDRLAPWLFTAARNRAIDHLRKHQRLVPMTLELLESAPAEGATPAAAMEERETRRDIAQWIADLPAKQREAVRLKFEGGLNYQQISEILETSPGNVGSLIHHGIRALRERWTALNA